MKSLTVSTLKYLFQGERALFRDTWIDSHWDWETQHPVVHISMTEVDTQEAPAESFLVQSGYLIFMGFEEGKAFFLGFPNQEVKDAFSQLILLHRYEIDPKQNDRIRDRIVDGLKSRDFALVFAQMQQLFSAIPYHLYLKREENKEEPGGLERLERYYHAVLLTLLWGCGIDAVAEEPSHLGRSHLVIRFGQDRWILELKKSSNGQAAKDAAQQGLDQIKEKGYGTRYTDHPLFLVGIGIDEEKRNLGCFAMKSEVL